MVTSKLTLAGVWLARQGSVLEMGEGSEWWPFWDLRSFRGELKE